MKSSYLLVGLLSSLLFAPAARSSVAPNATTPLGPGYHLDATPATPGTPGFIDPCWFIGVTGDLLPAVQSLDLTDPTAPVLTSNLLHPPNPNAPQDFKLFIGMILPPSSMPQFSFTLPSTGLDGRNNYFWSAMFGSDGPSFTGMFHLDAGDGSVTKWSIVTPPADSLGGRSDFEIDFTVTPKSSTDPKVTFSLQQSFGGSNSAMNFAPAPEPASMVLLGCGIGAIFTRRRIVKSRKN